MHPIGRQLDARPFPSAIRMIPCAVQRLQLPPRRPKSNRVVTADSSFLFFFHPVCWSCARSWRMANQHSPFFFQVSALHLRTMDSSPVFHQPAHCSIAPCFASALFLSSTLGDGLRLHRRAKRRRPCSVHLDGRFRAFRQ